MIRKLLTLLVAGFICFCLLAGSASSQATMGRYPKGRIFLASGQMIEGKNIIIGGDTVTMSGMTYQFSEVQQIMIKKGSGSKWACGCGGGCLAFYAVGLLATDVSSEFETSQIIVEVVLMSSISYGVGYLIGYLLNDWTPIYFAPRGAYSPKPLYPPLALNRSRTDWLPFRLGLHF